MGTRTTRADTGPTSRDAVDPLGSAAATANGGGHGPGPTRC